MYRIQILDYTGSTVVATLFNAVVHGWSKRISSEGTMTFSMPIGDTTATDSNLQKYRQVNLFRQRQDGTLTYEIVWTGFIEATKENGQYIDVICKGLLGLFKKRATANNQVFSGQGSADAASLLSGNDRGITAGSGGVVTTRNVTVQSIIDIMHAWELLAAAHNAEFEIDDTRHFNFVSSLGSDKTAITLRFHRNDVPGNNVSLTGLGEDGQPMANQIIGTSTALGGLTSTQNDVTSQGIYGLLTEVKAFHEAQDQATLDQMTSQYLGQRAYPLTDYAMEPILATQVFDTLTGGQKLSGIQYGDIGVGDLITADVVTENQSFLQTRRVAEIDVSTDENYGERVAYTLSKSGVFVTAGYLQVGSINQMRSRIARIETLLS